MNGRVAITGWGAVAACGIGPEEFAASLFKGRSALGEVTSFDVTGLRSERAAEVEAFDVKPYLRTPKNFLDRNSELGFAACEMAVRSAGLRVPPADRTAAGLSVGSAAGNLATLAMFRETLLAKGPRLVPPFLFPHTYPNTTASLLCIEYGLAGPHMVFTSGGAASGHALAFAADVLSRGRAALMLAGGVEAFDEPLYRGAAAAGWLSPTDGGEESCVPFGPSRNGTVLGEGAALFVLETAAHASARKAHVRAWVLAAATGSTAAASMEAAFARAAAKPSRVDLVVAAAGGYRDLDAEEAEAVARLFGPRRVPVTAPKALFGETLGAGGALNLAAALAALERGALPPTCGLPHSAPDGIDLTTQPRNAAPLTVLVNAAHPDGGAWATVIVGRDGQSPDQRP